MRLFLLPGGFCILWLACTAGSARADDFIVDFRGKPYDRKQFRPTGSNHRRVVQSDARGLRIALPADHVNGQPVGLVANTGVQGDFEITMEFEVVQIGKPTAGGGAGVSIYLVTASAAHEAATIGRFVRRDGAQVVGVHRATTSPDGKRQHFSESLATEAQAGKLRLVRTGKMLSYQFAQGRSDRFQEIFEAELGDADVESVRFAAENNRSPTVVDVRIAAVSIKGGALGEARVAETAWPWLLLLTATGLVLALTGLVIAIWKKRKQHEQLEE